MGERFPSDKTPLVKEMWDKRATKHSQWFQQSPVGEKKGKDSFVLRAGQYTKRRGTTCERNWPRGKGYTMEGQKKGKHLLPCGGA